MRVSYERILNMAMRILVADKLAEEGLDFLKQSGIEFDARVGLKEDELAAAVGMEPPVVSASAAYGSRS